MNDILLARAADVLRDYPGAGLPVSELADRLRDEGDLSCTAETLERWLRTDDRFRLLEPAAAMPDLADWPAAARSVYDSALRRAGLGRGPVVVLIAWDEEPDAPDELARSLTRTVRQLVERAPVDVTLIDAADETRRALSWAGAGPADHPTTRPPGPRLAARSPRHPRPPSRPPLPRP